MKVLLCTLNAKYIHMNLAIRILYGQNKHIPGLDWKEFTIREDLDTLAAQCLSYDCVCFSVYIWNVKQTLALAEKIKKINPAVRILLGGPEVSYDWQPVLMLPQIDYIIPGEGEIPFAQFMQHFPHIESCRGVAYKEENAIRFEPETQRFELSGFENFNPYVFEDPTEIANKVAYIETSRGCPYHCEFCLASLDNKVRQMPMQTIREQLLYLMQHGRVIKFLDRTFNVRKDFSLEIFSFILQHHKPGNVFQFEITADIVHPDIVAFIQKEVPPGLFRFEIGIQTVNQTANLEVSRKQNFEKTAAVIKSLENKIEMHLDLIVGLPHDYPADIQNSIEKVFALHPPELQLGFLKFLKGTPVRDKHTQYDYVFDEQAPYQIQESRFLSKQDLHEITLLEEVLELYWNSKRAIHALQYAGEKYGIYPFLKGLGFYFAERAAFHQHTFRQSYEIMLSYLQEFYPSDIALQHCLIFDYYQHFKLRPEPLGELEMPRSAWPAWILQTDRAEGTRLTVLALNILPSGKGAVSVRTEKEFLLLSYDARNKASWRPLSAEEMK